MDPPSYFNVPVGMKLYKGKLFVADACHCRIAIIDARNMAYEREIIVKEGGSRAHFLLLRVAFDNDGAMWVSDGDNSRIFKLRENGDIIDQDKIVRPGTSDGEFRLPNGIAFDEFGYIYVADEWNHRVQKLDHSGNYVDKIDTGPRTFPQDITIKNGCLYVTLTWTDQVVKYDLKNLRLQQTFYLPKKAIPRGIDVADNDDVVVAATGLNKTIIFTKQGLIKAVITNAFNPLNSPESIGMPTAVQITPDCSTIYQVQSAVHVVQKYELHNDIYQLVDHAGQVRNQSFQLNFPCGFSRKQLRGVSKLAVADRYNHRVQVFNDIGQYERTICGSPQYPFVQPSDVLYGDDEKIYVCDGLPDLVKGRITVFNSDWQFIKTIQFDKTTLPATDGVFFPFRLAMDPQEKNLFCVDGCKDAVHKIDPNEGIILRSYVGSTNDNGPKRGLSIHPNGDVYVIDQALSMIFHFDNNLVLQQCFGRFGLTGSDKEGMFFPSDLSFSEDGHLLFVADSGNFQLKVFKDDVFLQNLGSIGVTAGHFFGIVALKAYGNNQITTCSAYCNEISDYSYGQIRT